MLIFAFRVLVPDDATRSGHVDANLVGPPVVVDVGGEVDKTVAVTFGRVELFDRLNLMRSPVRRLIPQVARDHIRLAVAVDVGDRDALRAEFAVQHDLLDPDLSGRFLRADPGVKPLRRRPGHQGEANRQNAINATEWKHVFHLSFSWKRFSLRTRQEHLQPLLLPRKLFTINRYGTGSGSDLAG